MFDIFFNRTPTEKIPVRPSVYHEKNQWKYESNSEKTDGNHTIIVGVKGDNTVLIIEADGTKVTLEMNDAATRDFIRKLQSTLNGT